MSSDSRIEHTLAALEAGCAGSPQEFFYLVRRKHDAEMNTPRHVEENTAEFYGKSSAKILKYHDRC